MGVRIWSLALLLLSCSRENQALQSLSTEKPHPKSCLFVSSSGKSDNEKRNPLDCLQEAMRRMHALQEDNNNMLLLRKPPIRIGPSSIPGAGTGVFATKNIKAGTIVGFYPVHGIGLERYDTNAIVAATKEDQDYFDQQNNDEDEEEDNDNNVSTTIIQKDHNYLLFLIGSRPLCGYQVTSDEEGGTLFVNVNPNRQLLLDSKNHGIWISHFINDGAIVEANSEEGLLDYYRKSRQRKNCVTIPFGPAPMLATVATQKIKKDDELFTTYGGSYWLDSLLEMVDNGVEEEEEEPVDITEAVQLQAKQTAQDLFDAVQNAKVAHAGLQTELETLFSSPLL